MALGGSSPKYRIAWLPGDGVGVDVLDAARIVLDALKLDAEYIHGGYRLGVLAQGGRCPAAAHHRPAQERERGHVRRHHIQADHGDPKLN